MIIYLHGFGSNGNAFKARLIKRLYPEIPIVSPDLPFEPVKAVALVKTIIEQRTNSEKCLIIGSSLGGFYGLHLSVTLKIPAVLLNPTVQPVADLMKRINNDTDFDHQLPNGWQSDYLNQMNSLYHKPEDIRNCDVHVYLNRDDELLKYTIAQNYFKKCGCKLTISDTGTHVFLNFTKILPEIIVYYHNL
ncbi:MAG: hypothetical protein JXR87_05610 [Candidatus Marinimicrobia bacterium]|nr:hypothetical protein [Candidatus Neomarinimicrobiota bacterium]